MEQIKNITTKALILIAGTALLIGVVGTYYWWQNSYESDSETNLTDATLTGGVVYRERVPLPAGSSLVVQLLDVTDKNTEPVLIAEQTIITRGENVPIAYAVPYNQSQIIADRQYAIEASILGEGDFYFATPELTPVLTGNNPTGNVDLLLTRNGMETNDDDGAVATLAGTSWTWVRTDNDSFASSSPVVSQNAREYVLNFRVGGSFNSTTDCNRIAGSYAINGEVLSLSSIAMTEMACPDTVDSLYASQLGRVSLYRIVGNELRLILQQDTGVMIYNRLGVTIPDTDPVEVITPDEPIGIGEDEGVFCAMDVFECPDGSFVGRVAPSCDFAACTAQ